MWRESCTDGSGNEQVRLTNLTASRLLFSPAQRSLNWLPVCRSQVHTTSVSLHLDACSLFTATLCPTLTISRKSWDARAWALKASAAHRSPRAWLFHSGCAGSLPPLLHSILINAALS